MKALRGYVQGYNAQAVVDRAADRDRRRGQQPTPGLRAPRTDGHRRPRRARSSAGVTEQPEVVVADAGYWHQQQMDQLAAEGIQVLIPPDAGKRKGARPGWDGGRYACMRTRARRPNSAAGSTDKRTGDDRAGIRPDQVQPQDRPVPTKRQIRRALRMAIGHRDPQPPEAPQPPDRHQRGLKRPRNGAHRRSGRGSHRSPIPPDRHTTRLRDSHG